MVTNLNNASLIKKLQLRDSKQNGGYKYMEFLFQFFLQSNICLGHIELGNGERKEDHT